MGHHSNHHHTVHIGCLHALQGSPYRQHSFRSEYSGSQIHKGRACSHLLCPQSGFHKIHLGIFHSCHRWCCVDRHTCLLQGHMYQNDHNTDKEHTWKKCKTLLNQMICNNIQETSWLCHIIYFVTNIYLVNKEWNQKTGKKFNKITTLTRQNYMKIMLCKQKHFKCSSEGTQTI